jgi:hypothetical protein
VIPPSREEGGGIAQPLNDVKAEDIVIESDLPVEIGHLEMRMPDMGAAGDRCLGRHAAIRFIAAFLDPRVKVSVTLILPDNI